MAQMDRVSISYVWVDVVVTACFCQRGTFDNADEKSYSLVCPSGHISTSSTIMMTSTPAHVSHSSVGCAPDDEEVVSGAGKEAG